MEKPLLVSSEYKSRHGKHINVGEEKENRGDLLIRFKNDLFWGAWVAQ